MDTFGQLESVEFPEWYDSLAEFEHTYKGYLNGVIVTMVNGKKYDLNFIDPARLQQSLDDNVLTGVNFFLERNLVVIQSVTKDNIIETINVMSKEVLWEQTFLEEDSKQ